jgi:predicted RND superfamily exporter protein
MFIKVLAAGTEHVVNLDCVDYYFSGTQGTVFKMVTGEMFGTTTPINEVNNHIERHFKRETIVNFAKAIVSAEGDSEKPMEDDDIVGWAIRLEKTISKRI